MALPVVGFGLAAATGHPVLPGDDLTQNFPLRALVGSDLARGHIPVWDPYLWSGTALLGGFNAGALYPFTVLFAVLPATVAWSVGEAAVYAVAASGLYVFLRAEGRSCVASFLGAVTFAFAGAMLGQIPHIGLVEGLSWLGWILFAQRGLASSRGAGACGWAGLLGALGGLVILAGDPRAISDVAVIAVVYGLALLWRHRGRWAVLLGGGLCAVAVAIMLGAAQILPGLAFLGISQRATTNYVFFAAGSLPWSTLLLLGSPYLFGAYGNLGMVQYAGPYNLPEVTSYIGLLPLAAAVALLPWQSIGGWRRLLGRGRQAGAQRYQGRGATTLAPERTDPPGRSARSPGGHVGAWWMLVIVGLLLSVAGSTPLGPVLSHIPLYGHERLQNRNLAEADLGLAVLFAIWVDRVVGPDRVRWTRRARRAAWGTLGLLALWCWLVAAWGLGLGPGLGAPANWRATASGVVPLMAASGAIATVAACLVGWLMAEPDERAAWARLPGWFPGQWAPGRWRRWAAGALVCLTAADVGFFVVNANWSAPAPATIRPGTAVTTALGRLLGPTGRFAVYDPAGRSPALQHPTRDTLGVPDLNILHRLQSVQGYSSIQSGSYAQATDTHGIGTLALSALEPAVAAQLDLRVLLTLPSYVSGPLKAYLIPKAWRPAGTVDGFVAFQSTAAPQPWMVEAPAASPAPAGTVPAGTVAPGATASVVVVQVRAPALLVRSVAFAPGWQADIQPAAGQPGRGHTVSVTQHDLVQAVPIGPGSWRVSWHYRPPGLHVGLELGAGGIAALVILTGIAAATRRRRAGTGPT